MQQPDPARVRSATFLAEVSVAAGLSLILGQLRLLVLPFGGSVTLAIAPLILVTMVAGLRTGLAAGAVAGVLHALNGGIIVHPIQLLMDYQLAWLALVFGASTARLIGQRAAVVLAGILHWLVFTVSGTIFFADTIEAASTAGLLVFSALYNAAHVIPETVLSMLVLPTLVRLHHRANPRTVTTAAS